MASGVKSWKGSDTATGEIPVPSDRPKSFMVKTLEGEVKLRWVSGENGSFFGTEMFAISISGISSERFLFGKNGSSTIAEDSG